MATKRMRVFAGPNGSGKTTILKSIQKVPRISLGVYVNADDIEAELLIIGNIDLVFLKSKILMKKLNCFFC